jgi:spermidine synthase
MIETCRRYFALPHSQRVSVHTDDAMHFLNHDQGRYGMLLVDIYSGKEIPVFLQREAFYLRCHQLLDKYGILVLNLLTTDANQFRDILWIIRQRFGLSTLCLTVPGYTNVLIFAFRKRPSLLTLAPLQAKAQQFKQTFDVDLSEWVTQLFSTNPTDGGELIF